MADLSFPWQMYMQAQQEKNKNQQDMYQNIAGLGQGLGQGMGTLANVLQQRKQQQQQQVQQKATSKTLNDIMNDPNVDSSVKSILPLAVQNPQAFQELSKYMNQKPSSPWRVVPGMLSKNGRPVQQNEQTGEMREASLDVTPTGRGNAAFGVSSTTWDNATDEDKNLAKALYEGNIRPSDLGYRDKSVGTKLANEYAIRNGLPAFKAFSGEVHAGTAKDFAFGKEGRNVLSLNTALGHTQSAMDAYDAIGNLDVRLLNTPLNKVRAETNDPNIVKLQTSLNALHGELATVFKGSAGTDQEIGHWSNVLSQDLTPKQAMAAISQVGDLLNSRLDALQTMRSTGMGKPAAAPLLSPHAKTVTQNIASRSGAAKSFSSVQEAESANLPVGTKVMINGRAATIQ